MSNPHNNKNQGAGALSAQEAYHLQQLAKAQQLARERALKRQRETEAAQRQTGNMVWGQNGVTEANGYVRDAQGNIRYVGTNR
ncbi:hypothetical protein BJX99DRAFT_261539 [Aspergillus californicus]